MTETTTASESRTAPLVIRAQHTPGPWHATGEVRAVEGVEEPLFCGELTEYRQKEWRGTIASIQSCDFINGITREEAKANARLIAAAPDLLEALERIAYSAHADTAPTLRGYAQDAISKVTEAK